MMWSRKRARAEALHFWQFSAENVFGLKRDLISLQLDLRRRLKRF